MNASRPCETCHDEVRSKTSGGQGKANSGWGAGFKKEARRVTNKQYLTEARQPPPLIRPFAALRPAPERAAELASPPYDVVSRAEAYDQARGKPWSFLHVSRPEIDLPMHTDPYDPAVYAKGAENFSRMLTAGVLRRDSRAYYYVYRLTAGTHSQTGLVAVASLQAYQESRIRRHELTVPEKEADRARHIEALNAQTGPVLLTYRYAAAVDALVAQAIDAEPAFDFRAADGVQHSLWVIHDAEQIQALSSQFAAIGRLYIADGHHRSAAAARVAAARRRGTSQATDEANYNYFLVVLFPDKGVRVLDYNRLVVDLNGHSEAEFLAEVAQQFRVEPAVAPVQPQQRQQFGMYLPGQWYRLTLAAEQVPSDDPVARLDVSLLTERLLVPILGIRNQRTDKRIDFIGGIRGLAALQQPVDEGRMAVAFSLYPTSIEDLLAVADSGLLMPPKSTWFEPKLADGLVSHMLD